VCPKGALYFGFGPPSLAKKAPAAHRTKKGMPLAEELFLGAAFLAAFLIFRGLYGLVPFLLSLGLAGCLSFSFAKLAEVPRRASVTFLGRSLKQEGKLTRGGFAFVGSMGGVLVLCLHSAFVQFHAQRSASAFEEVRARREEFLLDPSRALSAAERERVEQGLASALLVRRFGLLDTEQNELQLAWFELFRGSPADFEAALRSAIEVARDPGPLHFDLGRFLEARGRLDDAGREYEATLAAQPSASVFDRLARLRFQAGGREDALAVFARALEVFPDNADLHFNHGVLLGLLERPEEAITAFRRVLELAPGRTDALENLAGLLSATGREEEARALRSRSPDPRGQ